MLVATTTRTGEDGNGPAELPWQRYVPLLVWILVIGAIVLVPLGIVGHGYLPGDDALRHAAKPLSGKSWSEILVLADWVKMDHNPGWHALLGAVHHLTNWNADGLVAFSVVALFICFCLAPLIWVRRPEAWLAVLIVVAIAIQKLLARLSFGRPYIISATVLMALLFLWRQIPPGRRPWKPFLVSMVLVAAATWIHGAWYFFVLPVAAFVLARQWQAACWIGAAWIGGAFVGAMFTGHPITFLWQGIEVVVHALSNHAPLNIIAGEFLPSDGEIYALIVIALVLVWRTSRGVSLSQLLYNPAFILVVLGWILGLRVMRFWLDCGLPALACWLAMQFDEPLERALRRDSLERLAITAGFAVALVFATTSDVNKRWTQNLDADYISAADPATEGWFPEPGGIIYNVQMGVFYQLFFMNPQAEWRYALGFEPTFMTPDNLQTYRSIQLKTDSKELFDPWIQKMRPGDRLVLENLTRPVIPELEWKRFGKRTWFGRLRASIDSSPPTSSPGIKPQ